jgi:hypothetical protein
MKTWMLGAAMVAGAAALGAMPAQAAEFGGRMRGPVAYVPPSPGPGYAWSNGYMANDYWVPGRWQFQNERRGFRSNEGEARRGRGYGHEDRRGYGGLERR